VRCAIGSDDTGPLTEALLAELGRRGVAAVCFGALDPRCADGAAWASIGRAVGSAVAAGEAEFGIVCCWTGTGIAIAANKVPGVRAALCADAPTAEGARRWNDANVLALSLRSTSPAIGSEILAAFLSTGSSAETADLKQIRLL
jgi:ribose 5-phosphate isomerase B